jgi:hypothetical protein
MSNKPDPIPQRSLAEQFKNLAKISKQKIEEDAKAGNPNDVKQAKKLYVKILKEIETNSKLGVSSLMWSNHYAWFGKWTVSFSLASAICNLLVKDGFIARKCESSSDPGQYYISIHW